jgi:hypothetical protein
VLHPYEPERHDGPQTLIAIRKAVASNRRGCGMGKLIYSMITSLDGYVSDRDGNFGWGTPDEESHQFMNDCTRSIGTYLLGRRMYEVMAYWETAHTVPG